MPTDGLMASHCDGLACLHQRSDVGSSTIVHLCAHPHYQTRRSLEVQLIQIPGISSELISKYLYLLSFPQALVATLLIMYEGLHPDRYRPSHKRSKAFICTGHCLVIQ